jgi:hypothetical protein
MGILKPFGFLGKRVPALTPTPTPTPTPTATPTPTPTPAAGKPTANMVWGYPNTYVSGTTWTRDANASLAVNLSLIGSYAADSGNVQLYVNNATNTYARYTSWNNSNSTNITMYLWFKLDDLTTQHTLMHYGSAGGCLGFCSCGPGCFFCCGGTAPAVNALTFKYDTFTNTVIKNGNGTLDSGFSPSVSTWYLMTWVRSSTTETFYFNNSVENSGSIPTNVNTGTSRNLYFGQTTAGINATNQLDGRIGNMYWYSTAHDSTDRTNFWNATKGDYGY